MKLMGSVEAKGKKSRIKRPLAYLQEDHEEGGDEVVDSLDITGGRVPADVIINVSDDSYL